jgi:hypothetical protein
MGIITKSKILSKNSVGFGYFARQNIKLKIRIAYFFKMALFSL